MPTAFTLIVLTFGAGTNAPPGVAMHSLPTRQACERAAAAVERLMGTGVRPGDGRVVSTSCVPEGEPQ